MKYELKKMLLKVNEPEENEPEEKAPSVPVPDDLVDLKIKCMNIKLRSDLKCMKYE